MLLCASVVAMASCDDDWTAIKSVDNHVQRPSEQDPELWAEYMAALRSYKQSDHYIVYARHANAPEQAVSEQDFMRCLPDSLDIVSLTNADNFSEFDAEDKLLMNQKGTKVLYLVDYAARREELNDDVKLGAYLDRVVESVAENHLDGYAFTAGGVIDDNSTVEAVALIVSKLSADAEKMLLFEGNPLYVAKSDRAKISYFVLDTESDEYTHDVLFKVLHAVGYGEVSSTKILLAARTNALLHDEQSVEHTAITEMSRRVIEFGAECGVLGGLGIYNIANDYYHPDRNYAVTREAIQIINPSK